MNLASNYGTANPSYQQPLMPSSMMSVPSVSIDARVSPTSPAPQSSYEAQMSRMSVDHVAEAAAHARSYHKQPESLQMYGWNHRNFGQLQSVNARADRQDTLLHRMAAAHIYGPDVAEFKRRYALKN